MMKQKTIQKADTLPYSNQLQPPTIGNTGSIQDGAGVDHSHGAKKSSAFYGILNFITMFIAAHHLTLTRFSWIQSKLHTLLL